jgi:hypothetical protein
LRAAANRIGGKVRSIRTRSLALRAGWREDRSEMYAQCRNRDAAFGGNCLGGFVGEQDPSGRVADDDAEGEGVDGRGVNPRVRRVALASQP